MCFFIFSKFPQDMDEIISTFVSVVLTAINLFNVTISYYSISINALLLHVCTSHSPPHTKVADESWSM